MFGKLIRFGMMYDFATKYDMIIEEALLTFLPSIVLRIASAFFIKPLIFDLLLEHNLCPYRAENLYRSMTM